MEISITIGSFIGEMSADNPVMGIGVCLVACVYFITKTIINKRTEVKTSDGE